MLRMLQAAQHQHQRPFTLVVHASETDQEVMQTVTNLHPACLVVLDAGEAQTWHAKSACAQNSHQMLPGRVYLPAPN
jgi:hypothetical protein